MLPIVPSEPLLFKCGIHTVNTATSPPITPPPSLTPESDVDELVDIFFDVDVAAYSYPRIESCDLQLGDTWRGMQCKMSVTAPDKKIRKKSDKPLSQINKCYNEKRRREQENETINQLEELLGTCLAEVKQPDKNGIVREATRQIQEVLKRRRECPEECPLRELQALSPVQAGEVSSTQPQPPLYRYTEISSLIEALKHYTASLGWILLEINCKEEIECVTENIKDLVLRDRTELYKTSIYSLLHDKDHAKLRPILRSIQHFNWTAGDSSKFQAIQAGLIVKNSNGTDTSVVEALIHAAPVYGSASEGAGSVMCVIRRCEDASAAFIPVGAATGPPAIHATTNADHIVFRLETNSYTVLSCDLSGVENYIKCPVSLVGARYLELIESADRGLVTAHLAEAACLPEPPAISEPFRIRVRADRPPVRVSARSRLFRAKPASGESDFIMSTHAVLDDAPDREPSLPNGDRDRDDDGERDAEPRYQPHPPLPPPPPAEGPFSMNDFELDPWLLGDISESKERKHSSAGEGSSTPRTPSTPAEALSPHRHHPTNQLSQHQQQQQQHSHHQHEEPTRLRSILTGKNNNILIGILRQEDEEATGSDSSAPPTPQGPLTPHTPQGPLTPHAVQSPGHSRPPHSQPHSHPQYVPHHHHGPQPSHHSHAGPASHSHHQHTPLVARILNDNTDEDAEEARRGSSSGRGGNGGSGGGGGGGSGSTMGHQSVLSKLLQTKNNGRPSSDNNPESTYLDKMTQKRKFEEDKGMATNAKRATPEHQQVSSSVVPVSVPTSSASPGSSSGGGMSQLCQKNQILVSLLAREQSTPTTPPQLTNPAVRPYGQAPGGTPRVRAPPPPPPPHSPHMPHHHPHHPQGQHQMRQHSALSDILTGNNQLNTHRMNSVNGGANTMHTAGAVGSHLANMLAGGAAPARYLPPLYGNPAHPAHPAHPTPRNYAHHQLQSQHHLQNSNLRPGAGSGDGEVPSPDKTLSEILDDILVTMPDPEQQRQENEDKNAVVHAITQSLMQCEKERTKHPIVSSPGTPPVYSVQSPTGGCPMPSTPAGMYGGRPTTVSGGAGAGASIAEHHVRLLQMQRTQQMLVSPEAAEQPQSDLGSTINALSETPPNVTLLPRGEYHPGIYQSNQMGANYGTVKMTSSQQNPMLTRQLSVGGSSGYGGGGGSGGGGVAAHAPAALHTPMTPMTSQQYHRAPRPHLVGGYYEGSGAGECGEYARCTPLPPQHPPHPPHPYRSPGHLHCPVNGSPGVAGGGGGVGGSGGVAGTSEYVRNELRAVVGARSARPDLHPLQSPDMDTLMSFDIAPPEYYGGGLGGGGGGVGGGR